MSYVPFFTTEFSTLDLKDKRLVKRAIEIGNTLFKSPGSCIQEVFRSKNEARCAYDFFSNPKVQWLNVLKAHQRQTLKRIQDCTSDVLYLIQDSTFYNYTSHKAKMDLGNIGQQGRFTQQGFLQHTALCVSGDDLALGLLELDFMGYEDKGPCADHRTGFNSLASSRWRRFMSQAASKLKPLDKKVILLCDREADFFEFLDDLYQTEFPFIIRSKWDRPTGPSGRARKNKFSELFCQAPSLGTAEMKTINPSTHQEEHKTFEIKVLTNVTLPAIFRKAGHRQNKLPPIKINVLKAAQKENQWVLLTNLPLENFNQALFVLEGYQKRWHIESFHKVLKTAYKAESIYLHSSREAIQSLLTFINIAACQTYKLLHHVRQTPTLSATAYFCPQELQALHFYCYQKPFQTEPSLQEVYQQIAFLGGYKNINNKYPPGILVLYRGIKKLGDITRIYESIMSTKT